MANLQLPTIFLLPTHLQPAELLELEAKITSLTYDANEAEVFVGRIAKRERALFELRRLKIETEPLQNETQGWDTSGFDTVEAITSSPSSPKRRKLSANGEAAATWSDIADSNIKVARLSWLTDSWDEGAVLPLKSYVVYQGRKIAASPRTELDRSDSTRGGTILPRAQAGLQIPPKKPLRAPGRSSASIHARVPASQTDPPVLLHQTTSEHDLPLPPVPSYLSTTYSCQRPTPFDSPNAQFIEQLKKVRTLRLLQGDQIGVRAYSTSIATVAAYPYPIQVPHELSRLPGCRNKIAILFQQWAEEGILKEVAESSHDSKLARLQTFYDIWGVGDVTAREFYKKGWRDLDDLVEYAWSSLSRVQQIGVKFYDDFLIKIPRPEVEAIAGQILSHARKMDPGYQMVIVGGYRRGKEGSGDVDVVISHPSEARTLFLIEKLVMSLEKADCITHTLSLSNRNSERDQMPVPWRGEGKKRSGFDTLDKALVVWHDPKQPDSPRRRVDIIISPWKTAGCAVLGWSGGTTFQRDLRRYCKANRGLKFDSSGIRSRTDGRWIDMEISQGRRATSMAEAEKMVFDRLQLTYREPEDRCTG